MGNCEGGLQRERDAWGYFSHERRVRAFIAGVRMGSAGQRRKQRLCFALALWNGKDPLLKERMFGVANGEGNHGEDVKEYYFYLDSTPTHWYMKMLYKYPHDEFPYSDLGRVFIWVGNGGGNRSGTFGVLASRGISRISKCLTL